MSLNQLLLYSQFSHSVVSDSLQPCGLQHARLSSPSPIYWSLLKLMSIKLECWQFDLWILCFFLNQLEYLEVHCSCTVEAWLGEF